MADCNDPTGPETPELPFFLKVDGNLGAVDFVKRLHAGGLELVNSDDGSYAVLKLAETSEPQEYPREQIEQQRRQLNKAAAVLLGAELTAEYNPEMSIVTDAISVARELVEGAIAALDSVNLEAP